MKTATNWTLYLITLTGSRDAARQVWEAACAASDANPSAEALAFEEYAQEAYVAAQAALQRAQQRALAARLVRSALLVEKTRAAVGA